MSARDFVMPFGKWKGETLEEVVAAARVMSAFSNHVEVADNSQFIDIVGTGGDGASTFNISTTCLFVLAAAGAKVAKHGNFARAAQHFSHKLAP